MEARPRRVLVEAEQFARFGNCLGFIRPLYTGEGCNQQLRTFFSSEYSARLIKFNCWVLLGRLRICKAVVRPALSLSRQPADTLDTPRYARSFTSAAPLYSVTRFIYTRSLRSRSLPAGASTPEGNLSASTISPGFKKCALLSRRGAAIAPW